LNLDDFFRLVLARKRSRVRAGTVTLLKDYEERTEPHHRSISRDHLAAGGNSMINVYVWRGEGGTLEADSTTTVVAMACSLEDAAAAIDIIDRHRSIRPITWRLGLRPWLEQCDDGAVYTVREKRSLIEPVVIQLPDAVAAVIPHPGVAWFVQELSD
jgi:hypothetical protein